jgi:hypothetical protein
LPDVLQGAGEELGIVPPSRRPPGQPAQLHPAAGESRLQDQLFDYCRSISGVELR